MAPTHSNPPLDSGIDERTANRCAESARALLGEVSEQTSQ